MYGAFLGVVWCFGRTFLKTPAGRQRLNVLGAMNAITRQFVSVINETYVTATTVCELLDKLRAMHGGEPHRQRRACPVEDRARRHHQPTPMTCRFWARPSPGRPIFLEDSP